MFCTVAAPIYILTSGVGGFERADDEFTFENVVLEAAETLEWEGGVDGRLAGPEQSRVAWLEAPLHAASAQGCCLKPWGWVERSEEGRMEESGLCLRKLQNSKVRRRRREARGMRGGQPNGHLQAERWSKRSHLWLPSLLLLYLASFSLPCARVPLQALPCSAFSLP